MRRYLIEAEAATQDLLTFRETYAPYPHLIPNFTIQYPHSGSKLEYSGRRQRRTGIDGLWSDQVIKHQRLYACFIFLLSRIHGSKRGRAGIIGCVFRLSDWERADTALLGFLSFVSPTYEGVLKSIIMYCEHELSMKFLTQK